jgi:Fe-S cluster assembly iron-binding protein IscA
VRTGAACIVDVLTLTDTATRMISRLARDRAVAPGGGLRIMRRDDHTALTMYLADHPEPNDIVLRQQDAAVFLAPIAARRLAGETLDARTNAAGAAFFLGERR